MFSKKTNQSPNHKNVRAELRVEALEDRTVPSAVVSVVKVADAAEGGAQGHFLFTRSGDLSEALTVRYTINESAPDSATWGGDYFGVTGTVGFGANDAGPADVTIMAWADNEIEDLEKVTLTLIGPPPDSPPYSISGNPTQEVTITDNAPQVSASAVWYSSSGPMMGQITLTRSGGNLYQPLKTWFESRGTISNQDQNIEVALGGTATFPAFTTTLTINVNANMLFGMFPNGEWAAPPPATLTQQRKNELSGLLNGGVNAGANFYAELSTVSPPNDYASLLLLRDLLDEVIVADAELFGVNGGTLRTQSIAYLEGLRTAAVIDWRTVPQPLAATVGWGGAYAWFFSTVPDWPRMQPQIDSLIAQLGDEDFSRRVSAEASLKQMIAGYMNRNDLTRAALVLGKVVQARDTSPDADVRRRALDVYLFGTSLNAMRIYVAQKISAAIATSGVGWTYPP